MSKTSLEQTIAEAAQIFAAQVIDAVKGATVQELIAMHGATSTSTQSGRRPEMSDPSAAAPVKKVKNYPKCAYPGCNKNRFVRGKGFCGEHWRLWKNGKIKSAEYYKAQAAAPQKGAKKAVKRGRASKK